MADARSVTFGLAMTFVVLALVGALVMQLVDGNEFSSFGLAVWWALQTVTTVGYGDVVPTSGVGQVVGGIVMVLGVSFIAFLTAGVTSTVVDRAQRDAQVADRAYLEREVERILGALTATRSEIAALEERLRRMESNLPD